MARTMGPYGSSALDGQAVAQDRHRLAQRPHSLDGLVEETGDADARRATEQHRPGHPVRGVVQSAGEAGKCLLASHEAPARVADRHTTFYGPGGRHPSHVPTGGVG